MHRHHHPQTQAQLLARMPRAFRPKLDARQQRDLALCHHINHSAIIQGRADETTLWHFVSSVLTWHHVAQALQTGVDEMAVQLDVATRLVERYGRTGRIGFDGVGLQAARIGLDVMDALAEIVDSPTAINAANWSEAEILKLQGVTV